MMCRSPSRVGPVRATLASVVDSLAAASMRNYSHSLEISLSSRDGALGTRQALHFTVAMGDTLSCFKRVDQSST